MAKDFFSLPEAAAMLGISRIAVFKKVRKSQIEAIRIGRNWAIAASVLNSYGKNPLPPPAAAKRPPKHHETKTDNVFLPPDKEMDDMGWD
ncbi:MAG TPA: hypothetical protein DCL44_10315 [Elusimicrobia bacterium]|nr:hypothetical protein [Elusimicrobiota bacterium]